MLKQNIVILIFFVHYFYNLSGVQKLVDTDIKYEHHATVLEPPVPEHTKYLRLQLLRSMPAKPVCCSQKTSSTYVSSFVRSFKINRTSRSYQSSNTPIEAPLNLNKLLHVPVVMSMPYLCYSTNLYSFVGMPCWFLQFLLPL